MNINKKITSVNRTVGRNGNSIKYIVIHYVGATGGAEDNCNYFLNTYRAASAHYFVGHAGEIWQCVEDKDTAWHCGGGLQGSGGHTFYQKCTNYNSIGIEMCVTKNGNNWVYNPKTLNSTAELVQAKMKEYNVPASNVIRHYDVTGKCCPANYLTDSTWKTLHDKLVNAPKSPTATTNVEKYSGYAQVICNELNYRNKPSWDANAVEGTVKKGFVFTITGRIKVDGVYMYQTKAGWYITSASQYVKYSKTNNFTSTTTTTTTKTLKVGSKVKIKSSATKYATGQTIPSTYKNKTYTVQKISGTKALIKELVSWVYTKDLTVL